MPLPVWKKKITKAVQRGKDYTFILKTPDYSPRKQKDLIWEVKKFVNSIIKPEKTLEENKDLTVKVEADILKKKIQFRIRFR
ncbi:hypothetical protein KAR91_52285 [Candidatus Pacearchaeota archaeon]|nr:hypothetical protein [Candidatus Pacearchaeota archaeon]